MWILHPYTTTTQFAYLGSLNVIHTQIHEHSSERWSQRLVSFQLSNLSSHMSKHPPCYKEVFFWSLSLSRPLEQHVSKALDVWALHKVLLGVAVVLLSPQDLREEALQIVLCVLVLGFFCPSFVYITREAMRNKYASLFRECTDLNIDLITEFFPGSGVLGNILKSSLITATVAWSVEIFPDLKEASKKESNQTSANLKVFQQK